MTMRRPILSLLLLAGGCVALPAPPPADPGAPPFPTFRFFAGATEGRGRLRVALHRTVPIMVHGRGRIEQDGTLVLDQTVIEGAKPPRDRRWRIREVAPGRFAGTLSDAAGPVTGEAAGGRLHLRFPMKGGLVAEQWLVPAPDGRSARNLLTVRGHGLAIARLDETIRRTGPLP